MSVPVRYLIGLCIVCTLFVACKEQVDPGPTPVVNVPTDFPSLPVPSDNQLTADRVALGKRLFFDKQLSSTQEISCASCHLQDNAFSDPNQFSLGINGLKGNRNAPALINLAYNTSFFWDGNKPTLEEQAKAPIQNPVEMGMTLDSVIGRLSADPTYVNLFRSAYNVDKPTSETMAKAIASFVRTMISGNSSYDRYRRGDSTALSLTEKRGMQIFFGEKGECFHCHVGFNFTNNQFQNNGSKLVYQDSGRMLVSKNPRDFGSFKVPTLRNIALTAPYMHDGSYATLEQVIDNYVRGGQGHPNTDPTIQPLTLTQQDKDDLVAFLKSLTDSTFINNANYKP